MNHLHSSYGEKNYDVHVIDFGDVDNDDIDDDLWVDVMMNRLGKRPGFMPTPAHKILTMEEREIWNKLCDEIKELSSEPYCVLE
eukprot:scaffold9578_cov85-Skeletonema_dohrnii-CCMP3373.AAC.2